MKSLSVKCVVIFIELLMFGYAEARGADWKSFFSPVSGTVSYDAQSITQGSENTFRVWTRQYLTDKGKTDMVARLGTTIQNVHYTMSAMEINCENKTVRTLGMYFYSTEGTLLNSVNVPEEKLVWDYIAPDTLSDALFKRVCDK